MNFHINISVQFSFVLIDRPNGRQGEAGVLIFEANPVEGICVRIVSLIELELEVELLKIFSGKEVIFFRSWKQGIGKSFSNLLLHKLFID